MSSVKRRLLASFGANSLGRVITTLIQLISVPLFLQHWGTHKYGEWILLNTIPSYFSLSDIGFSGVAVNEMTVVMARQKVEEALEIFQSVWVLTTSASTFTGLLLFFCIWFVPLERWMHLHYLSRADARLIVLFLGLSVLLSMQETLFGAAFRCVGQYAYGQMMKSFVILASFAVILFPLILGVQPAGVALCYFIVNGAGTIILWHLLKRKVSWIALGVHHARWRTIRRLTIPAISIMSLPFANVLSLQGILFVVGHALGPIAVVTYSTARTVSRSASQVMQLVNNSVWPELSAAFGARNLVLARRLHSRACQISLFLCFCIATFVAVVGRFVWTAWTIGKVPTDPILLDIMLVQLVVSSLWYTSSVVPISINKHQKMATVLVISSSLSLLFSWILTRVPFLQLRGAAAGMLLGDMINLIYVLKISLDLLEDTPAAFLSSLWSRPAFLRGDFVKHALSTFLNLRHRKGGA
jgi:O-antigen/teichoic acid export membrane protein